MKYDVAIIGGGLSGLTAAVDLSLRGAKVIVLEQSLELGGRCYSFTDPATGDIIDNGQHVLIGAYHNTLRYLDMIGARQLLREDENRTLYFHHPVKGMCGFSLERLPAGIKAPKGFLTSRLFSPRDRIGMLAIALQLLSRDEKLEKKLRLLTVEEWLVRSGQSEEARRSFWYPVAVSVMNELPEKADAVLLARAMKAAFLGKESDSTVLIPSVGQTELYVKPAMELLKGKGSEIQTGAEVQCLTIRNGKTQGVLLKNGTRIDAEKVISSVPYYAFERMLPAEVRSGGVFGYLGMFNSSPIISINLWFDRKFMPETYVGLIGRRIQWLFNRNAILAGDRKGGAVLSAVISGAYRYIDRSKEDLVQMALEDIASVYPESAGAKLNHSSVIKEKRATLSCTPEAEQVRPLTRTTIGNLFLAGDWTDTGFPGTIEGAVMSGFSAAIAAER